MQALRRIGNARQSYLYNSVGRSFEVVSDLQKNGRRWRRVKGIRVEALSKKEKGHVTSQRMPCCFVFRLLPAMDTNKPNHFTSTSDRDRAIFSAPGDTVCVCSSTHLGESWARIPRGANWHGRSMLATKAFVTAQPCDRQSSSPVDLCRLRFSVPCLQATAYGCFGLERENMHLFDIWPVSGSTSTLALLLFQTPQNPIDDDMLVFSKMLGCEGARPQHSEPCRPTCRTKSPSPGSKPVMCASPRPSTRRARMP